MGVIRRTLASAEDYRIIWRFIAQDNVDAASRLLRNFDERLAMLAAHPLAGRSRSHLLKNLRSFSVGEYILFYRPVRDGIELLRVIHGTRKFRRAMFKT